MNNTEQSRDAFEDWARNKPNAPAYFGRSNGGYYIEDDVAALWEGWKAGWDARAESPAGTPDSCVVCGGGPVYCIACADRRGHVAKTNKKVTTSPERVQIPAESKHDAPLSVAAAFAIMRTEQDKRAEQQEAELRKLKRTCTIPTCRAEMRPGLHWGGPNCPLRPA